jgi:hypothetical protein
MSSINAVFTSNDPATSVSSNPVIAAWLGTGIGVASGLATFVLATVPAWFPVIGDFRSIGLVPRRTAPGPPNLNRLDRFLRTPLILNFLDGFVNWRNYFRSLAPNLPEQAKIDHFPGISPIFFLSFE